jgi:electron transfer flavoprotein alpha subunit
MRFGTATRSEGKYRELEKLGSLRPIWVLVHHSKGNIAFATKEMLQDAKEAAHALGMEVWAILINGGSNAEPWAEQVGAFGADGLVRVHAEGVLHLSAEALALILDELRSAYGAPHLMLIANTLEGQEIAARLAMKWNTAYAHDCVSFSVNLEGKVEAIRVTHREEKETIVSFQKYPAIVSFRPGSAGLGAETPGRVVKQEDYIVDLSTKRFDQRITKMIAADPSKVDICEADFILACGYGVKDDETFRIFQEVAKRLGAAVAGTRRANDKGWINTERRVGLTGKTVTPELYMAVGISGAREHVVGMDGAKTIVAINNDAKAEIFRLAHRGYIGDGKEVMLALLKRLKVSEAA